MSTAVETPTRRPRAPIVAIVVLAVATAAWLALVVLGHGHAPAPATMPVMDGGTPHTHGPATPRASGLWSALAGWSLMVVAMMLPPALPLASVLTRLHARHRPRWGAAVGLAAFVSVWIVVGLVLLGGDSAVDALTGPWSAEARVRLAGALVVLAGAYQFAPLKNACLTACRTPRWFALRFWRGRSPAREGATISVAYGVSCVGCCWALMLLGLGTGALALPVMIVLTLLMTAERLLPGPAATRLVRASGAVLVVGGLLLLAGVVPVSLVHPLLGV